MRYAHKNVAINLSIISVVSRDTVTVDIAITMNVTI